MCACWIRAGSLAAEFNRRSLGAKKANFGTSPYSVRRRTEYGDVPTLSPGTPILPSMTTSEATWDNLTARRARRMLPRNVASLASDLLPLCDFLVLLLAAPLSTLLYALGRAPLAPATGFGGAYEQAALVAAVLAPFILYDKRFGTAASRGQTALLLRSYALRFTLFAGVILALGGVSQTLQHIPRGWVAIWIVTSLLLTASTRVTAARVLRNLQNRGLLTEIIAVVGAGPVADRLVKALHQTQPKDIELLGVFDDVAANAAPGKSNLAGNLTQLIELSKTRKIDWILLTLPPSADMQMLSIVQRLKELPIPIGLCPQHVGLAVPYHTVNYVAGSIPVSLLADRPIQRWNAVVKGMEDYLLGGIITLLLLPVLAIVALAIKIDSPGPVIFKQRRHAYNNHEFDIYKFRTMRWNPAAAAGDLVQTSPNDERFTRVGRFIRSTSLDELPQLFNVLKGDMSLVGPRPHAVNMRTEARLGHEITDVYPHRHRVKPGITGWSQVNGSRGAVDVSAQMRRRVELDLYYIDHWSLLLDLKILLMTCRVVLKRTNAY